MRTVVLDTSSIVRLYVPDGPLPPGIEDRIEEAWRSEAVLLVPELALAEVAQVLRKKEARGLIDPATADEILEAVLELPIDVVGHRELIEDAVSLARKLDASVYDSLFIALALSRKAELVTADARLAKAMAACAPSTRGKSRT